MTEPKTTKTEPSETAAMIKFIAELPELKKDSDNPEGWRYVSIDEYYLKIAKALAKIGYSWVASERAFELRGENVIATYDFTMYTNAGASPLPMSTLSVIHPYEGAQTSGKCVSYAEKIFMRMLVKAVTGEPDADATDSRAVKAADAWSGLDAQPELDPKATLSVIGMCKTVDQLSALWTSNKQALDALREQDKGQYDQLFNAVKKRKAELEA